VQKCTQNAFSPYCFLRNPTEELLLFRELCTKSLWNSCGELCKALTAAEKAMKFRKLGRFRPPGLTHFGELSM
jgi:hypothetical protein